jgi:hypothetical protein
MTDHGRLDITDKASPLFCFCHPPPATPTNPPTQIKAAVQPNSTKSYGKQAGQEIRGKVDQVMSAAQPQTEKSTIQKISDKRESRVASR